MRVLSLSLAAILGLGGFVLSASPTAAQRIIHVGSRSGGVHARPALRHRAHRPVRHHANRFRIGYGVSRATRARAHRVVRHRRHHHGRDVQFSGFARPDQHVFPLYYGAVRPWSQGVGRPPAPRGGRTVEQGSRWRGTIRGGRTVEAGSVWRGRIRGGATVTGGSQWSGRVRGGRTVRQGSRWSSHMGNWRFSGYQSPMRPRGARYFHSR